MFVFVCIERVYKAILKVNFVDFYFLNLLVENERGEDIWFCNFVFLLIFM